MIVVATTLTTFAMLGDERVWSYWLRNAEAIHASTDEPVQFFAAIETDVRRLEPFEPLLEHLRALDGEWWDYTLDDGRTEVTTANRQRHLTMGENLASEYAASAGASHLLFVAADCAPPPDVLPRLLEVDEGIVGAEVSTYCLTGSTPEREYPFPVLAQPFTAACVLIRRDVFTRLRWRCDGDLGLTDDPAYEHDARELLGLRTYVRKDCIAEHWPPAIPPIEGRGYDLRVVR